MASPAMIGLTIVATFFCVILFIQILQVEKLRKSYLYDGVPIANTTPSSSFNELRVFNLFVQDCSQKTDKNEFAILVYDDYNSQQLVNYIGSNGAVCVFDQYIYIIRTKQKEVDVEGIFFTLTPVRVTEKANLQENVVCFTQLMAYDNVVPSRFKKKHIVITAFLSKSSVL